MAYCCLTQPRPPLCQGEVVTKKNTHKDQDRAWVRRVKYCESVGLAEEDVYLDGFLRHNRIIIMGAFAMAMREGVFLRRFDGPLAESAVRGTISHVSLSFGDNGRVNPTKDEDGELGRVLSRLFRTFLNKDPNPQTIKSSYSPSTSDDVQKKKLNPKKLSDSLESEHSSGSCAPVNIWQTP